MTLIEDLHWIDPTSAEFLEQMVEAQAGSRRLLLLNFRPEYHAEWMQKSWYRQVPLTPLGLEATAELLSDLLGSGPSIASLVAPIHARTGGNPFFTEEIVQGLIESGQLEGSRGAYRLVAQVEQLIVPATVQALLAARIDRLAERDKRVLQVASVIGKDFSEPLLAAVAELPAEDLKAALNALRRAEFIYEQALYPIAEYSIKHPLTQEVALGSQLKDRRRLVHRAVAQAIEDQDAGHLDERAPLLAQHWEEAGEALIGARWHRRAAEWVGSTDIPAAARHWQRVRALLRGLPIDGDVATLGIAACTQLLSLAFRVGTDANEARELREEGQAIARGVDDRRAELTLSMAYGSALLAAIGDAVAYLEHAIEDQRVALDIDDLELQVNAHANLGRALFFAAQFDHAIRLTEDGLARFPRHLPRKQWLLGMNPYTLLSCWRAWSLHWAGRLVDAREERGRWRRLAEEDESLEMICYLEVIAGEAHYLARDADLALAAARRAEDITRTLGEPANMVGHTSLIFGYAHLTAGRVSDAIAAARVAFEHHQRTDRIWAGSAATLLAEALLAAGDLLAAVTAAEEAISWCRRNGRGNYEAIAHGVMARTLLRRDGVAARSAVETALDDAAALIDRTGACSLSPALLEWRAELAAVVGDALAGEKLLDQAEQGYAEIDAPKQVERLAVRRQTRGG